MSPRIPIGLAVELTDAWFEHAGGISRLRIAIATPGLPKEFECPVDFLGGAALRFTHVANIKGRQIFEARESCSASGEGPHEPGPLWRLSGPLQRGSRVVS